MFLLFSGPILLIAILSIAHLITCEEEEFQECVISRLFESSCIVFFQSLLRIQHVRILFIPDLLIQKIFSLGYRNKSSKHPSISLWTYPILVDDPFGVVSAAEFIGILLFVVYVIWPIYAYTMQNISYIYSSHLIALKKKCISIPQLAGLQLGITALFCLAFLLLPIARGSVLLRLIDIPFVDATKYHVYVVGKLHNADLNPPWTILYNCMGIGGHSQLPIWARGLDLRGFRCLDWIGYLFRFNWYQSLVTVCAVPGSSLAPA
ncbi:hypothetical protein GH714_019072 [Hevea brasiliensis]|uniref:CSC1/OSCA1-like 7TM region domain-containing protein n=1 Tax=Hevea brasiliensis TaxID=3981 RepID=A0A6A6MYL1_HEVBR|nr:hypothetical protein GH714_019072 [Hevea brasiliensis]